MSRTVMMRPVRGGVPLDTGSVDEFISRASAVFGGGLPREGTLELNREHLPELTTLVKLYGNGDGSSAWEKIRDMIERVGAVEIWVGS